MIVDVTDDPFEWMKFWTEVDDNGEPYVPPVHCYSPRKGSTGIEVTNHRETDEQCKSSTHYYSPHT